MGKRHTEISNADSSIEERIANVEADLAEIKNALRENQIYSGAGNAIEDAALGGDPAPAD